MKLYRKYRCGLHNYFMRSIPDLQDVIAIAFIDKHGKQGACMTWGKIFKHDELIGIIKDLLVQYGFANTASIKYCYSLQAVSKYPNFYEQWIYFVQQDIPYRNGYRQWVQKKRELVQQGQDVKFLSLDLVIHS